MSQGKIHFETFYAPVLLTFVILIAANSTEFLAYVTSDGWMLALNYRHFGLSNINPNRPLVPSVVPFDLETSYSHVGLGFLGLNERHIDAVRLECSTTRHPRRMDFESRDVSVFRLALESGIQNTMNVTWNGF